MPQLTRTFSNPTGTVEATGLDQLEEIRRGRQSSDALAREALAAQMAENAANRQSNQQIQGSFADRAGLQDRMLQSQLNAAREQQQLANQGGLDVARINVGPNQAYADLAGRKYADEQAAAASGRRLEDLYNETERGIVARMFATGGNAPIPGMFNAAAEKAGFSTGPQRTDQETLRLLREARGGAPVDQRARGFEDARVKRAYEMLDNPDPAVRAAAERTIRAVDPGFDPALYPRQKAGSVPALKREGEALRSYVELPQYAAEVSRVADAMTKLDAGVSLPQIRDMTYGLIQKLVDNGIGLELAKQQVGEELRNALQTANPAVQQRVGPFLEEFR